MGKKIQRSVRTSLFRLNFPFLQAVPTAVLGKGSFELIKVLGPEKKDFEYLAERFKQYEF